MINLFRDLLRTYWKEVNHRQGLTVSRTNKLQVLAVLEVLLRKFINPRLDVLTQKNKNNIFYTGYFDQTHKHINTSSAGYWGKKKEDRIKHTPALPPVNDTADELPDDIPDNWGWAGQLIKNPIGRPKVELSSASSCYPSPDEEPKKGKRKRQKTSLIVRGKVIVEGNKQLKKVETEKSFINKNDVNDEKEQINSSNKAIYIADQQPQSKELIPETETFDKIGTTFPQEISSKNKKKSFIKQLCSQLFLNKNLEDKSQKDNICEQESLTKINTEKDPGNIQNDTTRIHKNNTNISHESKTEIEKSSLELKTPKHDRVSDERVGDISKRSNEFTQENMKYNFLVRPKKIKPDCPREISCSEFNTSYYKSKVTNKREKTSVIPSLIERNKSLNNRIVISKESDLTCKTNKTKETHFSGSCPAIYKLLCKQTVKKSLNSPSKSQPELVNKNLKTTKECESDMNRSNSCFTLEPKLKKPYHSPEIRKSVEDFQKVSNTNRKYIRKSENNVLKGNKNIETLSAERLKNIAKEKDISQESHQFIYETIMGFQINKPLNKRDKTIFKKICKAKYKLRAEKNKLSGRKHDMKQFKDSKNYKEIIKDNDDTQVNKSESCINKYLSSTSECRNLKDSQKDNTFVESSVHKKMSTQMLRTTNRDDSLKCEIKEKVNSEVNKCLTALPHKNGFKKENNKVESKDAFKLNDHNLQTKIDKKNAKRHGSKDNIKTNGSRKLQGNKGLFKTRSIKSKEMPLGKLKKAKVVSKKINNKAKKKELIKSNKELLSDEKICFERNKSNKSENKKLCKTKKDKSTEEESEKLTKNKCTKLSEDLKNKENSNVEEVANTLEPSGASNKTQCSTKSNENSTNEIISSSSIRKKSKNKKPKIENISEGVSESQKEKVKLFRKVSQVICNKRATSFSGINKPQNQKYQKYSKTGTDICQDTTEIEIGKKTDILVNDKISNKVSNIRDVGNAVISKSSEKSIASKSVKAKRSKRKNEKVKVCWDKKMSVKMKNSTSTNTIKPHESNQKSSEKWRDTNRNVKHKKTNFSRLFKNQLLRQSKPKQRKLKKSENSSKPSSNIAITIKSKRNLVKNRTNILMGDNNSAQTAKFQVLEKGLKGSKKTQICSLHTLRERDLEDTGKTFDDIKIKSSNEFREDVSYIDNHIGFIEFLKLKSNHLISHNLNKRIEFKKILDSFMYERKNDITDSTMLQLKRHPSISNLITNKSQFPIKFSDVGNVPQDIIEKKLSTASNLRKTELLDCEHKQSGYQTKVRKENATKVSKENKAKEGDINTVPTRSRNANQITINVNSDFEHRICNGPNVDKNKGYSLTDSNEEIKKNNNNSKSEFNSNYNVDYLNKFRCIVPSQQTTISKLNTSNSLPCTPLGKQTSSSTGNYNTPKTCSNTSFVKGDNTKINTLINFNKNKSIKQMKTMTTNLNHEKQKKADQLLNREKNINIYQPIAQKVEPTPLTMKNKDKFCNGVEETLKNINNLYFKNILINSPNSIKTNKIQHAITNKLISKPVLGPTKHESLYKVDADIGSHNRKNVGLKKNQHQNNIDNIKLQRSRSITLGMAELKTKIPILKDEKFEQRALPLSTIKSTLPLEKEKVHCKEKRDYNKSICQKTPIRNRTPDLRLSKGFTSSKAPLHSPLNKTIKNTTKPNTADSLLMTYSTEQKVHVKGKFLNSKMQESLRQNKLPSINVANTKISRNHSRVD